MPKELVSQGIAAYKAGGSEVFLRPVESDSDSGAWAAMSAIFRRPANDYAYNLFTGVEMPYRGRKLAQAVKVLALRYARDVLGAARVRTQHNIKNLPMIAIDRKLGCHQTPGIFMVEKILVAESL